MNWLQNLGASLFGFQQRAESITGPDDYFILDPKADFSQFTSDAAKLMVVFTNPAVLKVFKLQCDMFSLGEVYVYQDGKSQKTDPFLNLIKNPNPFQQKSQFLWDYMFWKMIGNAYCYVDSDNAKSETNKLYFLDVCKMSFPDQLNRYKDKLIFSNAAVKAINDLEITYTYSDGSTDKIKWGKISHVSDLSNGTGNWFKGRSTIDALYEIISNSKWSIKSKNINVRYAGKFMVAGQQDPSDVTALPMSDPEKRDIETKMNGRKVVHAVKSMVDIKRFVEQASIVGELDASYWDDYFKIGSEFGIPRDVLEASLKGATYDNQQEARGAHVEYTLSPAGNQLMNLFNKRFGYTDKTILMSWDHLSFMQIFAKRKAETANLTSKTLLNLMKAGVKKEEINSLLDTEFTELDYEPAKRATANNNSQQTGTT